jgi:hypothetical protein
MHFCWIEIWDGQPNNMFTTVVLSYCFPERGNPSVPIVTLDSVLKEGKLDDGWLRMIFCFAVSLGCRRPV